MEKLIVCCLLIASLASLQAHDDDFVMIPGACILEHNTIVIRRVTREWCEDACRADPTCESYEYRPDRQVCHTSTKSSSDADLFMDPCHVDGYDLYDRIRHDHPHSTTVADGPDSTTTPTDPDGCVGGDVWLDITDPPYTIPATGWTEIWNKRPSHCKVQGVLKLTPPAGKTAVQLELTFDGPYGQTVFDIADAPNTYGFRTNICGDDAEVWGFHDSFEICLGSGVLALDRDETLREKFTIQLGDGMMAVSNHHDWDHLFNYDLFEMDGSNAIWFGVNHATDVDSGKWGDGFCSLCVRWYDDWDDLPPLTTI